MRGFAAAIAALALLIYATAPLLHGLVHPDHEIVAALKAPSGKSEDHTPPQHAPAQDCDLFKLYAGHGAHALAPPAPSLLVQPALPVADAAIRIDPVPLGAPRGFALGRGPPNLA